MQIWYNATELQTYFLYGRSQNDWQSFIIDFQNLQTYFLCVINTVNIAAASFNKLDNPVKHGFIWRCGVILWFSTDVRGLTKVFTILSHTFISHFERQIYFILNLFHKIKPHKVVDKE